MPLLPSSALAPPARLTYLGISAICRRHLSVSTPRLDPSTYNSSSFTNQPYTGFYEPGGPTEGPLRDASSTLRITPKSLKDHLDTFVVGQDRAKRTLATAVYNHYRRIQELQRRDDEAEELFAQEERRRMASVNRHPVEGMEGELRDGIHVPALTRVRADEDEFPGQATTVDGWGEEGSRRGTREQEQGRKGGQQQQQSQQQQEGQAPLYDPTPLTIEKSNILLLGPSGVGKTLMAKTLARVLEVPFSMSDCTPFTQAGYIGEDAEVCVQRLLSAANYDVERAERGIICLDEIDKIATAKVSHGKDVSGEGVQQSLLKIIEGTTVQVQAKTERGSSTPGSANPSSSSTRGAHHGYPTYSPLSGGGSSGPANMSGGSSSQPQKGETYNVKTDNILFICAGAFNGLHKTILDRLSKGSIGFGAPVHARSPDPGSNPDTDHYTTLTGTEAHKNLPYHLSPHLTPNFNNPTIPTTPTKIPTLSLTTPTDLQTFGLIPELVGRLPLTCALHPLSLSALVQVLTEPRNSLLRQYEQLFALSGIDLRFSSLALRAVAARASNMGIGARGLRGVMEGVLETAMFEAPGSWVRCVFVGREAAEGREGVGFWGREGRAEFRRVAQAEEEVFEREEAERRAREEGEGESEMEKRARINREGGVARTFEEYRSKASAGGF